MMDAEWLDRARQLRAEAWEAVLATSAFIAFKKFDDLVIDMGGTTALGEVDVAASWKATTQRAMEAAARRFSDTRKLSQADAAEVALAQRREPTPIGVLLEAAIERGAEIRGADPLSNFRSALSKDDRFYALRRNNMHYWWLKNELLPAAWRDQPGGEPAGAQTERQPEADDEVP
jgi:hypothetical protein